MKEKEITLKLPEPGIDPRDPWNGDLLGREKLAQQLTQVVETQERPLRIGLHGPWGSGKTWLLRRWQQHLKNEGFWAVYYNAWEDDFCRDPLLGILGQLHQEFRGHQNLQVTLREMGMTAGRVLAAAGITATGYLGLDLTRIIDVLTRNPLKRHARERESLRHLRKMLEDLAGEAVESTGKPLVFIVDELDRCRPEYALECLERIKHLMEAPGMIFLLGINRNQICESIRHAAGVGDPSTYLQRFFDLELNLPLPDHRSFCAAKMKETGIEGWAEGTAERGYQGIPRYQMYTKLLNWMATASRSTGLSLREIEHWVRMIALATRGIPRKEEAALDTTLLEVLPLVKIKNPELYRRYSGGNTKTKEVMDFLEEITGGTGGAHHEGDFTNQAIGESLLRIEVALIAANHNRDQDTSQQLNALRSGKEAPRTELLTGRLQAAKPEEINKIIEGRMGMFGPGIHSPYLMEMIELIDLYNPTGPWERAPSPFFQEEGPAGEWTG